MLEPHLSKEQIDQVLNRLDLDSPPTIDLNGLNHLYRAWCHHVPFDNIIKMIDLQGTDDQSLSGIHAQDFFNAWLQHGTSGTCWTSSNGLYTLLSVLGFNARRLSGSMLDMGKPNHGSVIVTLEDQEWLVDSSMLLNHVIPLSKDIPYLYNDGVIKVEVEAVEDTYLIWFGSPGLPDYIPCRLLDDPVDHSYYSACYEQSRQFSPFNGSLYARLNYPGEIRILRGNTRIVRSAGGDETAILSEKELHQALREDIGISEACIRNWTTSGGLEASMQGNTSMETPPPIKGKPPSQR